MAVVTGAGIIGRIKTERGNQAVMTIKPDCKYLKRSAKGVWWCYIDMALPYSIRKTMKAKEPPFRLGRVKKVCDHCTYHTGMI